MTAMTTLEPGFEPTHRDIVCARGRTAYNHKGNQHFRGILERNLEKYQSAKTKQQKTIVVNALLDKIKDHSRFVRKLPDGTWIEVPEHVAKEKIGQGFRDLLHTEYRSSTKSKVKLRRERRKRQKREQQEQQSGGHRPSNSLETFEPLPLDDSTASTDELIYDCTPFAFGAAKEDHPHKVAGDDDDENAHGKPTEPAGPTKVEGDTNEEAAAAPRQEMTLEVSSIEVPTFVTPASAPSPNRQPQTHSVHDGPPPSTSKPIPSRDHYPSWQQNPEGHGPHHPPPPGPPGGMGPHYSPPGHDYYHPRQHYSPRYSPPHDYHHIHAPPPPPPQYPASHHHHHNAASPRSGGWPPYRHHPSYGNYHGGYHYASPHPSLHYAGSGLRRGYSYQPAPEDYYSPPPQGRDEYSRDGYHNRYPPEPDYRPPEHNRGDERPRSLVAGDDQMHTHQGGQDQRLPDPRGREKDEAARALRRSNPVGSDEGSFQASV